MDRILHGKGFSRFFLHTQLFGYRYILDGVGTECMFGILEG